jgi:tetratricopeptide (TPR) repeat protein
MGFFDSIRQVVTGQPNGRGRGLVEKLNLKVVRLFEEGRFREATEAARLLVDAQREEVGEDHPDYATALSNLALLLQKQGDLAGAEPLLRQVLVTRQKALGEDHPDHATSLNNLGELLTIRENLEGAEPLLRQALAIRREVLGEGHPDYAVSLNSLALLLNKRGDASGAESLLRQAIDIRREMLGEFHADYAAGLSNLANLLFERGDLARAEELMRQALEIRRAALGEHHPDSLATFNNLVTLLQRRAEASSDEAPTSRAGPSADPSPPLDRSPIHARDAPPSGSRDGGPGTTLEGDEGTEELSLLTDLFREAAEQLRAAGRRMQAGGLFPDADLFRTLAVCHDRLSSLSAEVRGRAESLGVPCPPPDQGFGLQEIRSLLAAVGRAESSKMRTEALEVLEGVLRLRPRDRDEPPALQECQARARELHQILSTSPTLESLPVVEQLARGEHPFAGLLTLVNDLGTLDDDRRAALSRAVAFAFGRDLAESVIQERFFLGREVPVPETAGRPSDRIP